MNAEPHNTATESSRRAWRRFDRWALVAVLGLQAFILTARWRAGRPSEREMAAIGGAAIESEAPSETREVRLARLAAARRPGVRAAPVGYPLGGGPRRMPASVESICTLAAWEVLRHSPTLDVREHADRFEVRMSAPGSVLERAHARIVGHHLEIVVPTFGAEVVRRQVQLPAPPDGEVTPRLEFTNGMLRVLVLKSADP